MQQKEITPRKLQQRKFLTILPALVIPFVFLAFYALGGGRGKDERPDLEQRMGFNMELPSPAKDKKTENMDKLAFYQKADEDSARRRQQFQMDPYHHREPFPGNLGATRPKMDTMAEALLGRLNLLKRRVGGEGASTQPKLLMPERRIRQSAEVVARPDTPAVDPELTRLEAMLDKIARVQQHEGINQKEQEGTRAQIANKPVSEAVPAVVEGDQELTNGATLAIRLSSGVSFDGISIPNGQMVYGIVAIANERLQIFIQSIRCGQSIVSTSWQVYDMDGLQGIRIPDGVGRQAVRQSADQSIGSLNLSTYDPSIGGQVANAGIQTARNIFSRKARLVRVKVPSGYHVLLRDTKMGGSAGTLRIVPDSVVTGASDSVKTALPSVVAPCADSLRPFLHESTSEGKVHLTLKGIYERSGVMWLYLVICNNSSHPFFINKPVCRICQKKRMRRMAMQELPVQALYDSVSTVVENFHPETIFIGLKPFFLGKDRQLVIHMEEKLGGRNLQLKIGSKQWYDAE